MRKPAAQILALLRTAPNTVCAAWGLICRGSPLSAAIGGGCNLDCEAVEGVYQLSVSIGAGDWFIPFAQGTAHYCDVPSGQPNGTLIVTFPMNGCALEVHPTATGNRFYHDSDGCHMPVLTSIAKFRSVYNQYSGNNNRPAEIFERKYGAEGTFVLATDGTRSPSTLISGGFEHTLICVKNGANWEVYQTAVCNTINTDTGVRTYWQIKNGSPLNLGVFSD